MSSILSPLIGVALFLALYFDFDADIGHFSAGSPFFLCFAVLSAAAAVYGVFTAITAQRKGLGFPAPLTEGPAAKIAPYAAALAAALLFITNVKNLFSSANAGIPAILAVVFLPGIAAFYVLGTLRPFRGGKLHGAMGIAAALSVNLHLFEGYFDFTLPLNSPIRTAAVVMNCAYLLSLVFTTGSFFGKASAPVCRFAKCIAISLTGGISLGLLLAAVFAPQNFPEGISVLRCALCLFAAASMLFQTFDRAAKEDVPTKTSQDITD